jgi:hypothetical protein
MSKGASLKLGAARKCRPLFLCDEFNTKALSDQGVAGEFSKAMLLGIVFGWV